MSSINSVGKNGIRSVLIAYDFSEASRKPLHHAIAIARSSSASFAKSMWTLWSWVHTREEDWAGWRWAQWRNRSSGKQIVSC